MRCFVASPVTLRQSQLEPYTLWMPLQRRPIHFSRLRRAQHTQQEFTKVIDEIDIVRCKLDGLPQCVQGYLIRIVQGAVLLGQGCVLSFVNLRSAISMGRIPYRNQ